MRLVTLPALFRFTGRIGRLEFWLGLIFHLVVLERLGLAQWAQWFVHHGAPGWEALPARIAAILDLWLLAAHVTRRWHDRDRSAWWWLIVAVPMIGVPWMLIELGFLAGSPHPNRWGPPARDPFEAFRVDRAPAAVLAAEAPVPPPRPDVPLPDVPPPDVPPPRPRAAIVAAGPSSVIRRRGDPGFHRPLYR